MPNTPPPPPYTDLQGANPNPELLRHSKFWLEDGSVVLHVENTVFRIHRSILCMNSEFFNEMFNIPQPEASEQFDGCPMVELHDELEDIEAFMQVLYNPLCWDDHNNTHEAAVSFSLRILKVSNKYGCHTFHKKAISVLKEYIPTEFSKFNDSRGVYTDSSMKYTTIFDILSLARKINLRIFMPSAYSLLAKNDPSKLMNVVRSIDSENLTLWKDAAISVIGRTALLTIQKDDIFKFALKFEQSTTCESRQNLTGSCKINLQNKDVEVVHSHRFYTGLPRWKDSVLARENLCGPCKAHATEMFNEGLRKLWDKLPEAFELGSWEALRKEAQGFE